LQPAEKRFRPRWANEFIHSCKEAALWLPARGDDVAMPGTGFAILLLGNFCRRRSGARRPHFYCDAATFAALFASFELLSMLCAAGRAVDRSNQARSGAANFLAGQIVKNRKATSIAEIEPLGLG
jgi:hypothetical protein